MTLHGPRNTPVPFLFEAPIIPDHDSTSRSLLIRARSNEQEAWDRLVALYAPLILHWCRRWNLSESDAADVFQEVFRSVALNLDRFRKERDCDTFRGWLRTITRNKANDHFRKLAGEPKGVGGTDAHLRMSQIPVQLQPEEPDDESETQAHDHLVHRALEQVREHFHDQTWRAFWRVAVDGQPAKEVADELSMSPGAVRVAKSRVLHRLREEMGDLID